MRHVVDKLVDKVDNQVGGQEGGGQAVGGELPGGGQAVGGGLAGTAKCTLLLTLPYTQLQHVTPASA